MNPFAQHFTYPKLIRYTIFPVIMMMFTSVYGAVDGLFLSNYAGKTAFAAVNFILPYLLIFNGFGFMFGAGGSALIGKTLGEGDEKKACEIFSNLFWVSLTSGVAVTLLALLFLRPVAAALGAQGTLLEDCVQYGRIYLLGVPLCIVQYEFQNLYAAAGKPKLGLYATVISGVANILLDALFVAGLGWGMPGAAFATVISQGIGGVIPFCYFSSKNDSLLHLVRARIDWKAMARICTNGFSEVVNNISISTVGMLYNVQLLHYAGEAGIAAFGVLMYVNFLFTAMFWGYVVGSAPIISFQYGAGNTTELSSLLHKSLGIILAGSAMMFVSAEVFARPFSHLFVGYDAQLMELTLRGFWIFSFNFIFAGFAIFSASFFTALNNGWVSALLSFLRTCVYQVVSILVLPLFWDIDGIWISLIAAEILSTVTGAAFLVHYKKRYHY